MTYIDIFITYNLFLPYSIAPASHACYPTGMCFTIPLRVLKVNKKHAIVEGNISVALGDILSVRPGQYLQVTGSIAVGVLTQSEGKKIRQLIKIYDAHA